MELTDPGIIDALAARISRDSDKEPKPAPKPRSVRFPKSRTAEVSLRTENSPHMQWKIKEMFAFRVLNEASGHAASGRIAQLAGRKLTAQVSEYLEPETCVRIDYDDAFLLGQVRSCWREGLAIFAAIELRHGLTGRKELGRSREEDR